MITNQHLKACGSSTGDYEAYKKLLFSVADAYDKELVDRHTTRSGVAHKWKVYQQLLEDTSPYDNDTLLDVLQEDNGYEGEHDNSYAVNLMNALKIY